MMIPPLIRLGPIPQPHPNKGLHQYVIMTKEHGWVIGYWWNGAPQELTLEGNHLRRRFFLDDPDILCWMPQDGT